MCQRHGQRKTIGIFFSIYSLNVLLMTQKVVSYQIADAIDVKEFCSAFKADLYFSDPTELFYKTDTDQFVYVFKYGAICFLNYDVFRISEFLRLISPYCKNKFQDSFTDEFLIETNARELRVGFNKVELPFSDIEV